MNYGYIRVSTDKQTVENQRYEIVHFLEKQGMVCDSWIEETVSGIKEPDKRKLGKLLKNLKTGDVLVCSELSRLGRSLLMVMGILNECMNREIQVWTIKDNFRLGADLTTKVLAFAFGLCAEIERDMISKRTIEALKRKRAEGVILGRPTGRKSTRVKCTGRENEIEKYLKRGWSKTKIARKMKIHRITLSNFMKERMADTPQE